MSYAITPSPDVNAAPVLAYGTSAAPPAGLHVDRGPRECVIELFPPRVTTEIRKSVAWATLVAILLALTPLGVTRVMRTERRADLDPKLEPVVCAVIFLATWPSMFAVRLAAAMALRVTVRIDVLPAAVRWTVSGFHLRYEKVRPRDDIAAVEFRMHGVRLKRRDRRGGDWLAFGTRDQQREICLLLGEALGVPVRGVRNPGPTAPCAAPSP